MTTWSHRDPAGLVPAIEASLADAGNAGAWVGAEAVRRLRAVLVATCVAGGAMGRTTPRATEGSFLVADPSDAGDFSNPERATAYASITRTIELLTRGQKLGPKAKVETDGGGAPTVDAGLTLGGTVAVIVVGLGMAAAAAFGAQKAAEVHDRELSRRTDIDDRERERRAKTERMLGTHAQMVSLLQAHFGAEATAGKELPLPPEAKQVLASLRATQEEVSRLADPGPRHEGPIPSPFPANFGDAAIGGIPLVLIVGAGVVAYVTLSRR